MYCYQEIYLQYNSNSGIALLVLFSIFELCVLLSWFMILIVGPGRAGKILPFCLETVSSKNTSIPNGIPIPLEENTKSNQSLGKTSVNIPDTKFIANRPPEVFMCDDNGYPLWCSVCQSVKLDRVHHSAEMGYCVERMDHMCNWLGTVIGQQNHRFFIQIQIYFLALIILMTASIPVYLRKIYERKNETSNSHIHLTLLLVISVLWGVLLIPFFITHIRYIFQNTTTLEEIKYFRSNINRQKYPVFNIELPLDASQLIAQKNSYTLPLNQRIRIFSKIRHGDPRPYDKNSKWRNWAETLGSNPFLWILPVPNHNLLHFIVKRVISNNSSTQRLLYNPRNKVDTTPETIEMNQQEKIRKQNTDIYNPKLIKLMINRAKNGEEGFVAYPGLQGLPQNFTIR